MPCKSFSSSLDSLSQHSIIILMAYKWSIACDTTADGMGGCQAGLLLALMMDRCLFVDFPFFNKYFDHELDFSWKRHAKRLLSHGHNATAPENMADRIPFGYVTIADVWMFKNMTEYFDKHYGVEMWKDLDWSAALLVNNPHHQVGKPDHSTVCWCLIVLLLNFGWLP